MNPPLRYLLDTNICIFIIKHRPATVRARFDGLRPGEVGLSAVTEAELLHGVYKSARVDHNLAAVLDFASQLVVLPFDSQVTGTYGRVRAGLEQVRAAHRTPGFPDRGHGAGPRPAPSHQQHPRVRTGAGPEA